MIKKSLLSAVILLVLHLLFVLHYPFVGEVTHQWQDNVYKAQKYIYSDKADTVMVGSSLSARIIGDSIPSIKSLSFGGCSVEDGLRIILSNKQVPKYILVESNFIFRNTSPELFSGITKGPMPIIRKWIPSLKEQYEPICIYNTIFNYVYYSYINMRRRQLGLKAEEEKPKSQNVSVDMNILNEGITRFINDDKTLSEEEINGRLHEVKGIIRELETKGCHFVFFEMPVNEKLVHLKKYDQTRNILYKEFPANKYLFLPSDTAKYLTTDGIHLDSEGQKRFSHYFRTIIEKTGLYK